MSVLRTFEITEWEPFEEGIWYSLGTGGADDYCWPGQLDYMGYVWELHRNDAYDTAGNPFFGEAPFFHTNLNEPLPQEVLDYQSQGFLRRLAIPYLSAWIDSLSGFKTVIYDNTVEN